MSAAEHTLQRFLAESARQFERGKGMAAQRSFELLCTIDATIFGAGTGALTPDELPEPVPEEVEALVGASSETPCLCAVRGVYRSLPWYRSARSGMPYAQVVGPGSLVAREDLRVGLFMLSSASVYPDHQHGADEVYIVLAGSGEWSLERGAYTRKRAGDIIEVPSMTIHALRTKAEPALVLWSWTGDIAMKRYSFV